jgi:hypothetical protein
MRCPNWEMLGHSWGGRLLVGVLVRLVIAVVISWEREGSRGGERERVVRKEDKEGC